MRARFPRHLLRDLHKLRVPYALEVLRLDKQLDIARLFLSLLNALGVRATSKQVVYSVAHFFLHFYQLSDIVLVVLLQLLAFLVILKQQVTKLALLFFQNTDLSLQLLLLVVPLLKQILNLIQSFLHREILPHHLTELVLLLRCLLSALQLFRYVA